MFVSEENVRAVNTETQCVSNLQSVAVFLAVADMDSSCRLLWELVGISPHRLRRFCEGKFKQPRACSTDRARYHIVWKRMTRRKVEPNVKFVSFKFQALLTKCRFLFQD